MIRMASKKRYRCLSFPIGIKDRVVFDVHQSVRATLIMSWPDGEEKLDLQTYRSVDNNSDRHKGVEIISNRFNPNYSNGIYQFIET